MVTVFRDDDLVKYLRILFHRLARMIRGSKLINLILELDLGQLHLFGNIVRSIFFIKCPFYALKASITAHICSYLDIS